MNKQKFLKELEKRLLILNETERQDTINEYRDIIEEKVKHGKTEEEAVNEFGSIDELAKEILAAYKINPEYQNKKSEAGEKAKEFVESTEGFIKKSAKKLSEVTENVAESLKESDVEITTEKVFEIVIKVILVLIGLSLLKLPFYFIEELGAGIFHIGLEPFNCILETLWKILVELVYLATCILIIFTIVNKYTKNTVLKRTKGFQEERPKEETYNSKKEPIKSNSIGSILLLIVKVFICISILLPLWGINVSLFIGIAFTIYFITKGVAMAGILILLIGLAWMSLEACNLIYQLLFQHKKWHPSSFMVGFVLTIVGSLMTFEYITSFTYYNHLSEEFIQETITYEETITQPTFITADHTEIVVDPNMENYKVKIDATYYKDYVKISMNHENESYIYFNIKNKENNFNWNRDINDKIIKILKEKKAYNYSLLDDVTVKIYVNESTKDLIR